VACRWRRSCSRARGSSLAGGAANLLCRLRSLVMSAAADHVVSEGDRGLLVVAVVDPQHPQPGAVIDRRVLVILLPPGPSGSGRGDGLPGPVWVGVVVRAAMNFTSIWTWWPGSCFSYRFHRRSFGLYRCEAGSRFMPSRSRIRHTPESLIYKSW
jgi:hypothetical protein